MQGQISEQASLKVGMAHRADLRPLAAPEIAFELDMCIGCDRCMRACPVPLSSQVHIADLNLATLTGAIAPHIARFTEECVMCGSCVPVCPVDNHRDLLMLSLKQRLGISWQEQPPVDTVKRALPPGWSLSLLLLSLREQPMFQDTKLVPNTFLLHFLSSSLIREVPAGTELLREGEFGREIYFVLSGSCEVLAQDSTGTALPLAVLQRGDYVGEQGMLTGQPRSCTVTVREDAVVLEVPEQVMRYLIEAVPPLERFFVQYNTARATEEIFKQLKLLQDIAPEDLHWLAGKATVKYYERDEVLFRESDRAQSVHEYLHVLLDGFVKVSRRTNRADQPQRVIAYRQRGDYFAGGMDTLGDQRTATATAITRVTVAEISRDQLKSLLKIYPDFRARLQDRLQSYREANAAAYSGVFEPVDRAQLERGLAQAAAPINALSDAQARAGLHALVDDGVVEGTDILLIDLDKCIHCDECVSACERRHGHSRMNREGMMVGNISVVNACRQCQDPVCLLCSRAGIARTPGGEVYITESCIGCGICAERCPYDNISIVTLDDDETTSAATLPTWQRFSRLFSKGSSATSSEHKTAPDRQGFTSRQGRKRLPLLQTAPQPGPLQPHQPDATFDALEAIRKKIAVKCDLCAGYANQACVQACPTGAALRVNPVTFFGTTEAILHRRAQ